MSSPAALAMAPNERPSRPIPGDFLSSAAPRVCHGIPTGFCTVSISQRERCSRLTAQSDAFLRLGFRLIFPIIETSD